jgi:hypothetical protein
MRSTAALGVGPPEGSDLAGRGEVMAEHEVRHPPAGRLHGGRERDPDVLAVGEHRVDAGEPVPRAGDVTQRPVP